MAVHDRSDPLGQVPDGTLLIKGFYRARLARTQADIAAAQRLRHLCFRGGPDEILRDHDKFDPRCQHLLIENLTTARLEGCCRLLPVPFGADLGQCYAAQFYDLSPLAEKLPKALEIGRFCIRPGVLDADVLRIAWGALTRFVEAQGVGFLFGCSSFAGTDPAAYAQAFGLLARSHLGPALRRPTRAAPEATALALAAAEPDLRAAIAQLPALLRSYLAMGGWVSDHAVIDRALGTLHVFTGVDVAAIPPARVRALRALAG